MSCCEENLPSPKSGGRRVEEESVVGGCEDLGHHPVPKRTICGIKYQTVGPYISIDMGASLALGQTPVLDAMAVPKTRLSFRDIFDDLIWLSGNKSEQG